MEPCLQFINVKENVLKKFVTAPSLRNPTTEVQQEKKVECNSIAGECKVIYTMLLG